MRIQISTIFIILLVQQSALACPACEKAQPKITRGLTHGVGPQNNWDWIIVALISVITVITFFYALKYIFKPGEKDDKHIKKTILNL
jgi:hypothetical protein